MRINTTAIILLIVVFLPPLFSPAAESIKSLTEMPLGQYGKICDHDAFDPVNLGPTGAIGWPRGNEILVTDVDFHSPADGLLREGDVILGANGSMLGNDPRLSLGKAITTAETTSAEGRLNLTVWRNEKKVSVIINLPVLGEYSPTWPYNCLKSKQIMTNACAYLDRNQMDNGLFRVCSGTEAYTPCAVNGLVFLASGKPEYMENARRLAYYLVRARNPIPDKGPGLDNWAWAYSGIFLSEYYLMTGDGNVLSFLDDLQKWISSNQTPCGSWSYGPNTSKPSEENQNQVGLACLLALVLIRDCGVDIDERALKKSLKFFDRFTWNESIAYGDHRPWAEPGGSGKDALAGIIFRLSGYSESSSRYFLQRTADLYLWAEHAPTGPYFSFLWGPLAANQAPSEWSRRFLDHWQWYYDLSRRWDGGFFPPPNDWNDGNRCTMLGPLFSTGGMALTYGLDKKRLQIMGAGKSVFSNVKLSSRLKNLRELFRGKRLREFPGESAGIEPKITAEEKPYYEQLKAAFNLHTNTVSLTLSSIRRNINNGNLKLAETSLKDLSLYIGKPNRGSYDLNIEISRKDLDRLNKAEQLLNNNRALCAIDSSSRRKIITVSRDNKLGRIRKEAIKILENTEKWPSYRDTPSIERELARYNSGRGKKPADPVSLKVIDKLAHSPGRFWAITAAQTLWKKSGLPQEGSIFDTLIRHINGAPGQWRYLYPPDGSEPENWNSVSFDDSSWGRAEDLFSGKSWNMKAPAMLTRGAFMLNDTDYDRLLIYCRTDTPADVYLNGKLVAKFLKGNYGLFQTYKLRDTAPSLLRKGKNVLAMSAKNQDKGIVISVALQGMPVREGPILAASVLKTAGPSTKTDGTSAPPQPPEIYDMSNRSTDELISLLKNESEMVRWLAASAFAGKGDTALNKLKKAINSENDPLTREHAVKALAYIGPSAETTIPELISILENDSSSLIRRAAADTIGYIAYCKQTPIKGAKKVIKSMTAALRDNNYNVRDSAAKALANFGPAAESAIPELVKALKDPEWWVRESAAKALVRIDTDGERIKPIFEKAAEKETHRWVLKALGKPITGVDMPISVDADTSSFKTVKSLP